MEKINEEFIPLSKAFSERWMNSTTATKIREGMRKALNALHEENSDGGPHVHGDLRSANILVSRRGDVRVIDFDWAGHEGDVFYPQVNHHLQWPQGVQCGRQLKRDHDLCLFRFHCLVLDRVVSNLPEDCLRM